MVLVGYEPGQKAYRLWECGTRKIVTAKDVEIVENAPKQTAIFIEPETDDSPTQDEAEKEKVQESTQKLVEPIAHRTRSKK